MRRNVLLSIDFDSTVERGKVVDYLYEITAVMVDGDQIIDSFTRKFIHEECIVGKDNITQSERWRELGEWMPKEDSYVIIWEEAIRIIVDKMNKAYGLVGPVRYLSLQKVIKTLFDYSFSWDMNLKEACELLKVELDETQKNRLSYKSSLLTEMYKKVYGCIYT